MAIILRILQCLNGRSKWTPKSLAEEFEISIATVHRYLKVLEAAGISYFYDRDYNGYQVARDHRLPALNFTPDELLSQGVAASVSREQGLALGRETREAVDKISATQRDERSKILDDAQRLIQVLDLKLADHSKHTEMIRSAQWALIEGKQLVGTYESPYKGKARKLRLHPYRIVLVRQAWYLIARPHDGTAPRTYRLARFSTLRRTDDGSVVPSEFDLKKYFGNAWGVYRGDKSYNVRLRFSKEAAPLVTETQWHPTQKVKKHPSGEVTLTFQVDGLDEILWWVLGWTGRVAVLEPTELREMVTEQLRQGMKLHEAVAKEKEDE
jgi:predicted DNA-binding transcriptional regulator YafY